VEATDTSINLKVPKPPLPGFRAAMVLLVLALGGAGAWAAVRWFGSTETIGVKFEYRGEQGGTRLIVPLETRALRFYEAPAQGPPLGSPDRRYSKTFTSAQTRYVHTEITLGLAAPGRYVGLPIACTVYSATDAVIGSFTIENTIEPNATSWVNERAWGAERPGSWKPGRYHVDCKYGEKLIARSGFEITG
jgi:hypothetical protein